MAFEREGADYFHSPMIPQGGKTRERINKLFAFMTPRVSCPHIKPTKNVCAFPINVFGVKLEDVVENAHQLKKAKNTFNVCYLQIQAIVR